MTRFVFGNKSIDLPAATVRPVASSRDANAWWAGQYATVRLFQPIRGLRLHTSGRSYPDRPASNAEGSWILIGDVIQTSSQIAQSRSLPGKLPQSMVAFTHVGAMSRWLQEPCSTSEWPAQNSLAKSGVGEGLRPSTCLEPWPQFHVLAGNYWHGNAGSSLVGYAGIEADSCYCQRRHRRWPRVNDCSWVRRVNPYQLLAGRQQLPLGSTRVGGSRFLTGSERSPCWNTITGTAGRSDVPAGLASDHATVVVL